MRRSGPYLCAVAATAALVAVVCAWPVQAMSPRTNVALSIRVQGNHFVNGQGHTVQLVGVNVSSTAWSCVWDDDYAETGTLTDASVLASWHINAVRIPLNEDCWLGINKLPSGAHVTAAGYRSAIESFVTALNRKGIYAILDAHYTAPGTWAATYSESMPDAHTLAFWTSVARAFAANHAVIFDAFNEPGIGSFNDRTAKTWNHWRNGGFSIAQYFSGLGSKSTLVTWTAVGMQQLVNAIRGVHGFPATGATQPILLGGVNYSNDLLEWLQYEPADPDHQLAAAFDNYWQTGTGTEGCDDTACWRSEIAPVAAKVPIVTAEFDEGYDCSGARGAPADGGHLPGNLAAFDTTYMNWADAHGVSYLGWGWFVPTPSPYPSCTSAEVTQNGSGGAGGEITLIRSFNGTAVAPDGTNLQAHLAALFHSGH